MAQKCDNLIQRALKCVDEAINFDSANSDKEAYIKYLESISIISSSLYTDVVHRPKDSKFLSRDQKQRLIDVARQCLDRIDVLFKKLDETVDLKPVSKNGSKDVEEANDYAERDSPSVVSGPTMKAADSNQRSLSVLEAIDWISPESASFSNISVVSPLEKVKQDNKNLIATYKVRLSRAPTFAAQTNIYLELQRRLAENLQVARKQQEIYFRSIQEKQKRHLDEVSRKVIRGDETASQEFYHRKEVCTKTIEYEKCQAWIADAKTKLTGNPNDSNLVDMIVRHILRDQNHPISQELKRRVESLNDKITPLIESYANKMKNQKSPSKPFPQQNLSDSPSSDSDNELGNYDSKNVPDEKVPVENIEEGTKDDGDKQTFEDSCVDTAHDVELAIKDSNAYINTLRSTLKKQKRALKKSFKKSKSISGVQDAPGTQTNKTQKRSLKRLESEALQRHLENIAGDALHLVEEVVELLVLAYAEMEQVDNLERCYLVIEDHALTIVWPHLMQLCSYAYSSEQKRMLTAMRMLQDCSPNKLGFSSRSSQDQPSAEDYNAAVAKLKQLPSLTSPTPKLELLVSVAKILCGKQMGPGNQTPSKTKPIGADDLIPLLSYTCIQTQIPELIHECHLLEFLINPKYLLGEAGYCLTSLQTALQYVQLLNTKKNQTE